ncbi:MAG: BolA family transcriptional regulator [Myxococcota bacterium]|nr:BolA family transcriptional regulator [Myxococcota bacterium]
MITADEIKQRLETGITDSTVTVTDMTGTQDHYDVTVISSVFEGVSMVERHRMVYAPLSDVMGGALHALKLSTKTPSEG